MAHPISPFTRGKNHFVRLIYGFLATELYFLLAITGSNTDIFIFCLFKGVLIGLLFYLSFIGIRWAKWALSAFLILNGCLFLLVAIENFDVVVMAATAFSGYSAIIIHGNKNIKLFLTQKNEQANQHPLYDPLAGDTPAAIVEDNNEYPSLVKRVQSTFIDGILTFILICLLLTLAININDNSVALKIVAIIIGISYEPLMVRYYKTIGQHITKITVVNVAPGQKVGLLRSYARFIVKTALGWLSFLVMFSNTQRRAIHDYIAETVVICD